MKLFDDLTPEEQTLAIEYEKENILFALASRQVKAVDPAVQNYVEQAINQAVRRGSPELAPAYIYHYTKLAIDNLAAINVKSNLYSEPHEVVVDNVVGCAFNKKNLH